MKYAILGLLLITTFSAHAQRITQISPPNIKFRGVSSFMCVGDSASIYSSGSQKIPSPCNNNHTFYGVSYPIVVGDSGLIFRLDSALPMYKAAYWVQLGTGITNQTLRAIVRFSKKGLITVGDSGIILLTIDNGNTWGRIESHTTRNINAISINDSGTGFFVGEHGLIGKTTNFGMTWTNVTDTNAFRYRTTSPVTLRGVAMSNHDSAVAVGDSGSVAIYTDAKQWTMLKPISLNINAYSQPDPSLDTLIDPVLEKTSLQGICYVLGSWGIFSESDLLCEVYKDSFRVSQAYSLAGDADGGVDYIPWRYDCGEFTYSGPNHAEYISAGAYESFFDNSVPLSSIFKCPLFASIDSHGIGYATTSGGNFLKTTDNGFSWNISAYYPTFDATDIYTFDDDNAFAIGWSGNLFRGSDGIIWDSVYIPGSNQERLHSIAHPEENVFVVCGDFGTMLRSTDNSKTWTSVSSTVPTAEYLESIAFSSKDTGIAVGTNGTIIRTTDEGLSWSLINNPLTGTKISFRQIVGFPSGIYYATTNSGGLYSSADHGEDWNVVTNVPNTVSEGFFSDKIGVIAEKTWTSAIVPDTVQFAFTRDGFATKPIEWTMPIFNNNRIIFHFLDSNTFLCYGANGFIVKVDMSQGLAGTTQISGSSYSDIHVFPNPSTGDFRIDYITKSTGPISIQLFSEDGKDMGTLYGGMEPAGIHQHKLTPPNELHGSFYLRITKDGLVETAPLSLH